MNYYGYLKKNSKIINTFMKKLKTFKEYVAEKDKLLTEKKKKKTTTIHSKQGSFAIP